MHHAARSNRRVEPNRQDWPDRHGFAKEKFIPALKTDAARQLSRKHL